jgi:hypothetical protein
MLDFNLTTGYLGDSQSGLVFADRPYRYAVRCAGLEAEAGLEERTIERPEGKIVLRGRFAGTPLELRQELRALEEGGLEETLTIHNAGEVEVEIADIQAGFCAGLEARPGWRLCAAPFRVQLDGSRHDYPVADLIAGSFHNPVFIDPTREYMPPLREDGRLRSEAWAWGEGEHGLLVIKYNPGEIELSVARPWTVEGETRLQFGGAGFSLYGEPGGARRLGAGAAFRFGTTAYLPYAGGISEAYRAYREFLDTHGHGLPVDYDPPLNWNELYDVGWYHSRTEDLGQHYTRAALLREAGKARAAGCDLLYLDPGWEVCEGTTLWDAGRLGEVHDLVETLSAEYGLGLGYRTILRTYKDHWPRELLIRHADGSRPEVPLGEQAFWEPCLCNPAFFEEKLRRTLAISRQGVRFMMIDEYDWRGPCHDPSHGHPVPTSALDHVRAVYRLCAEIRKACPEMLIECHDPVWPWATSIYVPTYFGQGFAAPGSYQENWGFEYMWDCLNDLRSGRALALYYYNLGCSIPLYLHITMAADNDACLFFWWCASTVRHLGIGGRDSHPSIEPPGGLPAYDAEKRFRAYQAQVRIYRQLKAYFARGVFHGVSETAHLHTLPGLPGGVLSLFNLADAEAEQDCFIPYKMLNAEEPLAVEGAAAEWEAAGLRVRLKMAGMTPALVRIGAAAGKA